MVKTTVTIAIQRR